MGGASVYLFPDSGGADRRFPLVKEAKMPPKQRRVKILKAARKLFKKIGYCSGVI